MSDTIYNARQYARVEMKELLAMLTTCFFASFALTFNDWGDETFDIAVGLRNWGLMLAFLLLAFVVVLWICKIVAVRVGYLIEYRAHLWGLMIGMVLTLASAGYLPIFLPGGFRFDRPERLRIGKFMPHYKGWEMGLIAATFPLAMLAMVLILSPLHLWTGAEFWAEMIVAVCLTAVYACIPVPMVQGRHDRVTDWWRYTQGCSFGLEVFWNSLSWFIVLCITVLVFTFLAFVLTLAAAVKVGFTVYAISLVLGLVGLWVYSKFFR